MAANGEERLLTLFADVHYYFGEPTARPSHHRFDKESYVYLYRDATNRRGRLEIANHAGTSEQDAFTGYLNASKIRQSHRHPTMVTVVVDGLKGVDPAPSNDHHWRLPSTDPRDEGKYLFRLHTLDIYFWTLDDASTFIRSVQQTLAPQQLEIDAPPPPTPHHNQAMSPVVQNLENMAISDPAYGNRAQKDRSARSTQPSQPVGAASNTQSPIPPPPQSAPPPEAKKEASTSFQPLAYNPAAPPAPEKHAHREKTPPPPEDGPGLTASAYGNSQQPQRYGSTTSIPSASSVGAGGPSPYASPPPTGPGALSYASPPPSSMASPPPGSQSSHRLSHAAQAYTPASPPASSPPGSYVGSPADPNAHLYGKPPPMDSPTAQILGPPDHTGHRQPLQHLQPQYADYLSARPQSNQQSPANQQQPGAPPGGYTEYDYSQRHHHHHQNQNPHGTGDTSIHGQVYRPTEEEAKKGRRSSIGSGLGGAGFGGDAKPAGPGTPGQNPGKWENRAEKAEKGINKFLRKVEKRIG